MAAEDCTFILRNCTLKWNVADIGVGGIHILTSQFNSKYSASIDQCWIVECSAPSIFVSTPFVLVSDTSITTNDLQFTPFHVHIKCEILTLKSTQIVQKYNGIVPPLIKQNMMRTESRKIANISTFRSNCSRNFKTNLRTRESSERISLEVSCEACARGTYTATNTFTIRKFPNKSEQIIGPQCLPCPQGATCDGSLRLQPNHWGYFTDNNTEISVVPCPSGYCSTRSDDIHDNCVEGRTGMLCGVCREGYFQSYTDDECVAKKEVDCSIAEFVIFFIITSNLYTILITFIPTVITVLKRRIANENDSAVTPSHIETFILHIVLSFQMLSMLHIDRENKILNPVFDVFNFHFSLYKSICPTHWLNFLTKTYIRLGLKLAVLVNTIWFLLLWKGFSALSSWCKKNSSAQPKLSYRSGGEVVRATCSEVQECHLVASCEIENSNDRATSTGTLTLGYINVLRLVYTPVVLILFRLVHCTTINNKPHLFNYGQHQCYSTWQYTTMFLLIPIFLLFPVSSEIALSMLRQRAISIKTFLLAYTVPLVGIVLAVKKRVGCLETLQINEVDASAEKLLQSDAVFTTRWMTILLYRNLFAAFLHTFLVNSIYKSVSFAILCVVCIAHDFYRNQFKHPFFDRFQRFSSLVFFVVNICNVPSLLTSMGHDSALPYMNTCVVVGRYLEIVLFVLILLSPLSWKMWTAVRRKMCWNSEEKCQLPTELSMS